MRRCCSIQPDAASRRLGSSWHGRDCASRVREIKPACSSTFRCLDTACWVILNGTASSATVALPVARRSRRAILERLATGKATVAELAVPFRMTQQAVSKHLKVLEQAGLISRTRDAQSRPCQLEPSRLDAASGWIEQHRRIWADRYD